MMTMTHADNDTSTLLLQYMFSMISQGNIDMILSVFQGQQRLGQITCGPRSQHSGCPWGEGVCISPAALTTPPHLSGIIKCWYLTTAIICVSGSQLSSEVCDRSVGIPVK